MRSLDSSQTGKHIHKLMIDAGLTYKDLQAACNLSSHNAVYKWFNGWTVPSVDNLIILADLFGCSVDDILITKEVQS